MATRGLPLDYDIVIYAGTNYKREFRWLPDGINPMDFTGWDAVLNVGQPLNTPDVQLTVASGEISFTADGRIVVAMSPARTASFKRTMTWYNMDLTEPGGFVRRFLRGRVSVVFDVSVPT
jgi:hypothetical protein